MPDRYIYIQNGSRTPERYELWETYNTHEEALTEAKRHKKQDKAKYFILRTEPGLWFPETKYRLYLTKVFKLW